MKSFGLITAAAFAFITFIFVPPAYSAGFSGLPVTSITLMDDRGNPWPKPEQIMPLIEIKPGTGFSSDAIRKGIEYLYLTGRFKDIRVEAFPHGDGVRLEYVLMPVTVVRKVVIEGNDFMPTDRIRGALSRIDGKEYREEKLQDLRMDILSLYHAEGYYEARVGFKTEQNADPHQVDLHIVIAESEPTLIEDIRFSGNTVLQDKDLLRVMKSRKGKPLRRDLLLDTDMGSILQKYTDAGYPAAKAGPVNMNFRNRKAYLLVLGNEGPKVTVTFTGNREFSQKELKDALLIWQEHDVSDAVLESSVEKIKNRYKVRGYAEVAVNMKKTEGPGLFDLEFFIREGPMVSVKDIFIQGNAAFTTKEIKKQMAMRESGWFSTKPYDEDLLNKDIEYIRDRYIDVGYLDAVVEKSVTQSADGRKASVLIKITEGKKTAVGRVSFEGNTVFKDDELQGRLGLKTGMPFSEQALEEDRYRILSAYSNKGCLYARVEAEKGAAEGTVDIRYRIAEDLPVTIGRIILRGNERTDDYVILRELLVKPGDAYEYGAILASQQRIYRLGYFGLARFEPVRPGEKEYVKDMLLTVEERPAGAVEFGLGYGDLDRFRGFVELSHSNLWGTARYASLRFEGSDIAKQAAFSFREPWFLGERIESRFRLAWSDTEKLNADTREIYYQTRKTVVSYGVEKAYTELKLSLMYQYENVENYNVKPGAILTREDTGRVLVSSITPGLIWDMRDDPFNPRKGSLHGVAVKEALQELGSEADFTKITFQTSWFLPVGVDATAALSARGGMAWPHRDTAEVPLHERFYAGGGSTIRGYLQDSVGPATVEPDGTLIPTGGSSMAIFNAELRISPSEGLGLVLFIDAGNAWPEHAIHLNDIRASYGLGIRYNTPVGPLRLDYGQKINRHGARLVPSATPGEPPVLVPGESPGEIHFNIGHAF